MTQEEFEGLYCRVSFKLFLPSVTQEEFEGNSTVETELATGAMNLESGHSVADNITAFRVYVPKSVNREAHQWVKVCF